MLSRMSIGIKVAVIAATISLIGILASVYASKVLHQIDSEYTSMNENLSDSALYLARLNRTINAMGYGAYRSIAYDDLRAEKGREAVLSAIDTGTKAIDLIIPRLLDRKDQIVEIQSDFVAISQNVQKAVDLGVASDNVGAQVIMGETDAKILEMTTEIQKLADETNRRVADRAHELNALSSSTIYLLIGGTVASAILGLIAALFVSAKGKVTQQNAAMVEETTAAAQTLSTETDELATMIGRFHTTNARSADTTRRSAPAARRPSTPVAQMRGTGFSGTARKPEPASEEWADF